MSFGANTNESIPQRKHSSELVGAAFLMATSAIGPGFLTQTAFFTSRLGADFAASVLLSALFDVVVQLTVWRVIIASERTAPEIANFVLIGSGSALTVMIVAGGIAFNCGNIAGAGLGLESAIGLDARFGAVLSAVLAASLFLRKGALNQMDRFAQAMGILMIAITLIIAWQSVPPLAEAASRAVMPQQFDITATLILVGGTVGGYITFAGGHRLLDAGLKGDTALRQTNISAGMGIAIATTMRLLLFIAALGITTRFGALDAQNPAASVFTFALGNTGTRLFGVVMWSAAITSVIGSAYTSISFLRTMIPRLQAHLSLSVIGFIMVSTVIFLLIGKPVRILVVAGLVNSFVIPIALVFMLIAAHKPAIVGTYKHPVWLTILSALVACLLLGMSMYALFGQ
jgi:Mn2+/Fe2+ NRAMP family transporter